MDSRVNYQVKKMDCCANCEHGVCVGYYECAIALVEKTTIGGKTKYSFYEEVDPLGY